MKPRFLVGVLYSGEVQYESCLRSILKQSGVDVEINNIIDLPNKEAHDKLYSSFMAQAGDFDFFVKVDADMVIGRETLFSEFHMCFLQHPELRMVTAPVWDFFTDQMIIGMHSYRSTVRWVQSEEKVFVDDSPVPETQHTIFKKLAPAAEHCINPSIYQAFYYGVHKGIKVRASLHDLPHREARLVFHWENLEKIWNHYLRTHDRRLLVACLGGELAVVGAFTIQHLNRSDERLRYEATKMEEVPEAALLQKVRRLRFRNRRGLTSSSRLEVLRDGLLRFILRRMVPLRVRDLIRSGSARFHR